MLGVSLGYAVSVLPVLLFYKYLESPDNFLKPCKKIRQGMIFAASGGGGGSEGAIPTTAQTSRYRDSGYRVAIPAGKCPLRAVQQFPKKAMHKLIFSEK